ncbi:MAG: zinc permease [Chryseobacterium sp.]|nr:MAG: zinc permease [Chryseobacterium sp.]
MIIILLLLSVLVGVLLGKFFGGNERLARRLLVLSAGFLITICVSEVFPEVYEQGGAQMGFWIVGGVLLQMLLESLTKGFEHGHFHMHDTGKQILPSALMFGLFIHAFVEGIPLADEVNPLSPYLLGILFHNLPISFVLGAFLLSPKNRTKFSWLIISLFAAASPLGMVLGGYFNPVWQPYFLALVGGNFLHISAVIIFESNRHHKMDWEKFSLVVLGVLLAMAGHLFHRH